MMKQDRGCKEAYVVHGDQEFRSEIKRHWKNLSFESGEDLRRFVLRRHAGSWLLSLSSMVLYREFCLIIRNHLLC